MIEICGASDDCVMVEGPGISDEFYADEAGCWQADLVAPGGTETMRVRAVFDPDGSGCWVISLSPVDVSVPFPDWGNGTGRGPAGYTTELRIDAPPGTRLENITGGGR